MKKIDGIHVFEDGAFLARITRASFAVMLAALALAAAWWVARQLPGLGVFPSELARDGADISLTAWLLALLAGVLLPLPLHEAIHAVAFKAFAPAGSRVTFGANWKRGMLFACADGIVYTRRQYLVIALAPAVALTALLIAVGAWLAWPLWTLVVVATHLAGCTGDLGYAVRIVTDRRIAYCEDTEWGVQFYAADDGGADGDADDAVEAEGATR